MPWSSIGFVLGRAKVKRERDGSLTSLPRLKLVKNFRLSTASLSPESQSGPLLVDFWQSVGSLLAGALSHPKAREWNVGIDFLDSGLDSVNSQSPDARALADALTNAAGCPVRLWDGVPEPVQTHYINGSALRASNDAVAIERYGGGGVGARQPVDASARAPVGSAPAPAELPVAAATSVGGALPPAQVSRMDDEEICAMATASAIFSIRAVAPISQLYATVENFRCAHSLRLLAQAHADGKSASDLSHKLQALLRTVTDPSAVSGTTGGVSLPGQIAALSQAFGGFQDASRAVWDTQPLAAAREVYNRVVESGAHAALKSQLASQLNTVGAEAARMSGALQNQLPSNPMDITSMATETFSKLLEDMKYPESAACIVPHAAGALLPKRKSLLLLPRNEVVPLFAELSTPLTLLKTRLGHMPISAMQQSGGGQIDRPQLQEYAAQFLVRVVGAKPREV